MEPDAKAVSNIAITTMKTRIEPLPLLMIPTVTSFIVADRFFLLREWPCRLKIELSKEAPEFERLSL